MELKPGTVSKIQLAWSRILGFDAGAMAAGGDRIYRENNSSSLLMFVSLFGKEALVGPSWAVEAARDLTGTELASHSTLLEISRPHGGWPLGEASLYFCGTLPSLTDECPTVSREPEHAAALEHRCPTDDVSEVNLSSMEHTYVLITGDDPPTQLAGAGYDIWKDTLAHIGVLTAPEERRRGRALQATSMAVAGAMASGLIPQWRARTDNAASHLTALSAGFVYAGSQTSVHLQPATVGQPGEGRMRCS